MTTIRENVPLAGLTTLRVGGPARRFVTAGTEAELIAEVRRADATGEPLLVLGGGSNLVIADEGFGGAVLRVVTRGVAVHGEDVGMAGVAEASGAGPAGPGTVTAAAGESWDSFVAWAVAGELSGVECLSGIPGLAGATPIQNVGAYGQEVAQTIVAVRVLDRVDGAVRELPAADCGFGYRTSEFKRDVAAHGGPTGRYIVLAVTFRLSRAPLSAPIRYRELARALGVAEGDRVPLADARDAVLGLRRGKGMVLDPADPDTASAGSFFTNPVLTEAEFRKLSELAAATPGGEAAVPSFPEGDGRRKVPAGWLIEHAGFVKGYPGLAAADGPRVSRKHTLALVNPGGASAAAVAALAREIRDGVRARFGVELVPEPVLVGVTL